MARPRPLFRLLAAPLAAVQPDEVLMTRLLNCAPARCPLNCAAPVCQMKASMKATPTQFSIGYCCCAMKLVAGDSDAQAMQFWWIVTCEYIPAEPTG
jgi:cytochrome c-type biogenesis protein CcmH